MTLAYFSKTSLSAKLFDWRLPIFCAENRTEIYCPFQNLYLMRNEWYLCCPFSWNLEKIQNCSNAPALFTAGCINTIIRTTVYVGCFQYLFALYSLNAEHVQCICRSTPWLQCSSNYTEMYTPCFAILLWYSPSCAFHVHFYSWISHETYITHFLLHFLLWLKHTFKIWFAEIMYVSITEESDSTLDDEVWLMLTRIFAKGAIVPSELLGCIQTFGIFRGIICTLENWKLCNETI